jgi:cytochrome c-type biogenesis protein CcmH
MKSMPSSCRWSKNWVMRNLIDCLLAACALLALSLPAMAMDTPLADAALETRAQALFHNIRCVVCQSESIAESPAEVASDMRRLIRQRIATGDSDEAITSYLAAHYGNVILMKPPLRQLTWPLWFGPPLMLAVAAWFAMRYFRKAARA